MKRIAMVVLSLGMLSSLPATAQKDMGIGGVVLTKKQTLQDDLSRSPVHKTLLRLLNAAGVADVLGGKDTYTLFAPTDDAFQKLPPGTLTSLLQPEHREELAALLRNHLVKGRIKDKRLRKLVKKGKGTGTLQTLGGGSLTLKRQGSILQILDEKGGMAVIVTEDIRAKNGVLQVVDSVLMPR
jgi:uncharacterized surface protein with fasciclin (FAS1) repeats